jgi:hypothetical protein
MPANTHPPLPPLTHPPLLQASGVLNTVAGQIDPTSGTTSTSSSTTTSGVDLLKSAAAGSDISALQGASQLLGLAQTSGLFPQKAIDAYKADNPEISTMINALTTGAGIGLAMNECYGSIEGDEAAIQSSLTSLGTSMVNSDSITAAAGMGQAMIMASSGKTPAQNEAMYQLFRIYLDQNANTGKALSTTQQKAYKSLTPECNAAFDDIVTTYQDSKGTVSSIMAGGKSNVTCANFQQNSTLVDMTLCVWPSAIWNNKDGIMANLTATFTNYGVGLCDVSFYIINIAENMGLKPTWLPDANTAFPNGIPQGAEIAIEASVPWTSEIAENKPVVDILKGWTACPNGRATAAPTAARTETPKTVTGVINEASQCFVTDACTAAVAPFANDKCGAYTQLLTSGCSTCSKEILESAARSCIKDCPANACGNLLDKGEVTSGAGVLSKAVAFVVTLVAAFAFAL